MSDPSPGRADASEATSPGRDPEAEWRPSPNVDSRRGAEPSLIVLHYTGMASADEALAWLRDPRSKVSAHYFVFEDGRLVQSVDETERAWHAGLSGWHQIRDVNAASIGVEIANPGHDHGYQEFPEPQIAATIGLVKRIMARWQIAPEGVVAHSDVAPGRKIDPGEKFPWERFAAAEIGRYVSPSPIMDGSALVVGDVGQPVARLQRSLASLGYPIEETASYDTYTETVVAAFQRHYRPERIDGRADRSTLATLERLASE
ncbi:N-acetylmuramoyl-L-alanine amidase [Amorphus sp. 3PC139-8]|uniref:N-acetylmuramoyl-L-alanine amidase n=1 Tax=Amorphus sp. 3PC139-8 TaxID=2735676 RepID=UPI00345D7C9C